MLFHKVAVMNQNVNLHWAQIRSAHLLTHPHDCSHLGSRKRTRRHSQSQKPDHIHVSRLLFRFAKA